jgi:hypothetical protein
MAVAITAALEPIRPFVRKKFSPEHLAHTRDTARVYLECGLGTRPFTSCR